MESTEVLLENRITDLKSNVNQLREIMVNFLNGIHLEIMFNDNIKKYNT